MPAAMEVSARVQVTATRADTRSTDSSLRVMRTLKPTLDQVSMTRRDHLPGGPAAGPDTDAGRGAQASSRRSTGKRSSAITSVKPQPCQRSGVAALVASSEWVRSG